MNQAKLKKKLAALKEQQEQTKVKKPVNVPIQAKAGTNMFDTQSIDLAAAESAVLSNSPATKIGFSNERPKKWRKYNDPTYAKAKSNRRR